MHIGSFMLPKLQELLQDLLANMSNMCRQW